jgi:hypothetical protein
VILLSLWVDSLFTIGDFMRILASVVFLGDDGLLHHQLQQLHLLRAHPPPFGVPLVLLKGLQVAQHAHQVTVVLLQVPDGSFKLYCLEGLVGFRREGGVRDLGLPDGGCFLAEEGTVQVRVFGGIRQVLP